MAKSHNNNQAGLSPGESLFQVELRLKALAHLIRSQKPETAPLAQCEQEDINHGLSLCLLTCVSQIVEARQAVEAL